MDVGEEVVVGEVVVGDRIVRDEAASSRAERSPKTLSPFSRTGLKRCGFGGLLSRPAVHAASRDGEDRSSSAVLRNLWRQEEEILVRLSERSDLPFIGAREGGERAATEAEGTEEDETNRQQPEAWRGVARRAAEEERAWMSLLFSCSYMWGKNLPYKEVQLPLN